MSKIIAIGTAVPPHKNQQKDILNFMLDAIEADEADRRKISMLYNRSGIETRYSAIPDYSLPMEEWTFYPKNKTLEPFPNIEKRRIFPTKMLFHCRLKLFRIVYKPLIINLLRI